MYKGKVAAFGAWYAFDRILNQERSKRWVYPAFDKVDENNPLANQRLLDDMMADSCRPFGNEECPEVFSHYQTFNYLAEKKQQCYVFSKGKQANGHTAVNTRITYLLPLWLTNRSMIFEIMFSTIPHLK